MSQHLTISPEEAADRLVIRELVEPAGDIIWVAERGAGKAMSIPVPK
ncbi:MAG: hypothetical protein WA510_32300 [Acidobacteriaceae bacterium]|jgi:hypothetical protein